MIYFTSDLHFGHKNIIRLCNEDFSSIEERDEYIIAQWNACIKDNDIVYILGDLSWYNNQKTIDLFKRMKGHKIIIKGNHDNLKQLNALLCAGVIERYTDYLKIKCEGLDLVLFHYPISDWGGRYKGSVHLFGHTHSKRNFDLENPMRIHVGVNSWNYSPVSIEDIKCIVEIFKNRKLLGVK